jgi:hypothetical protein
MRTLLSAVTMKNQAGVQLLCHRLAHQLPGPCSCCLSIPVLNVIKMHQASAATAAAAAHVLLILLLLLLLSRTS